MEGKTSFGARAESLQGHYQHHEDASASLAVFSVDTSKNTPLLENAPRVTVCSYDFRKVHINPR